MGYSTPMLEQCNKYNSTHNVSVSDKSIWVNSFNMLKKSFNGYY